MEVKARYILRRLLFIFLALLASFWSDETSAQEAVEFYVSKWQIECHPRAPGQTPDNFRQKLRDAMKLRTEVARWATPYNGYPVDGQCEDREWQVHVLLRKDEKPAPAVIKKK